MSRWIEPYTIADTSSIVIRDEPFIFNNIRTKAEQTINISKSCDDLTYNIIEYRNFVEKYVLSKGYDLEFVVYVSPCLPGPEPSPALVESIMRMKSADMDLRSNFTMEWVPS
jgi:hypothetical protein